jgi:hypothetical protein
MMNEAPERAWLTKAEASWRAFPYDDMPVKQVEYIRADVAAAQVEQSRQDVWKKAIELARAIRPDGSINFVGDWNRARKQFVEALEAARQSGKEGE